MDDEKMMTDGDDDCDAGVISEDSKSSDDVDAKDLDVGVSYVSLRPPNFHCD
jgi:hypothetical protein